MAVYPNGRYMSMNPGRHFGVAPGADVYLRGRNDAFNRFIGETFARNASTPDGYGPGGAFVLPIKAGSMSSFVNDLVDMAGSMDLKAGGKMTGTASATLSGDGMALALVVGLSGSGTWSLAGDNLVLRGVFQLQGVGTWSLTGDGSNLGMRIPLSGDGTWALSGSADLRGRLSLVGAWTPFTELSPEGLATAVWNRLATDANVAGTMGAKVNAAGSASDPWATPEGQSVVNNTGLIPALI